MGNIEIVVKMPEEEYDIIKNYTAPMTWVEHLIKNGTPLPKGHGRLIDADALQKSYCDYNCGVRKCVDAMDRCVFIGSVLEAPTIIEADQPESEDKE